MLYKFCQYKCCDMYLYSRLWAVMFSVTNRLVFKALLLSLFLWGHLWINETLLLLVTTRVQSVSLRTPWMCLSAILVENTVDKSSHSHLLLLVLSHSNWTFIRGDRIDLSWYSLQQLRCWIVSNLGLVFNTHLHTLNTIVFEYVIKEDIFQMLP